MPSSRRSTSIVILVLGTSLAACTTGPSFQEPVVGVDNTTHDELVELPPPQDKIAVAVYAFEDETGQFEHSERVQTLSRAVTQGATSILIEALLRTGDGSWFTVVEREGLDNLLRERQIIRETRAIYQGDGDLSQNYVPPLLFAGMLLEGGIIGFDTNTLTGGLGARLLGIGGSTEFRQDTVTVYLRAISTQSGEILESVNVSKTIFSIALSADVFRFVSSDEILEIDAGVTSNEPEHVAVKQAIEKAVIALILEGARDERWAFAEAAAAAALLGDGPPAEAEDDATGLAEDSSRGTASDEPAAAAAPEADPASDPPAIRRATAAGDDSELRKEAEQVLDILIAAARTRPRPLFHYDAMRSQSGRPEQRHLVRRTGGRGRAPAPQARKEPGDASSEATRHPG